MAKQIAPRKTLSKKAAVSKGKSPDAYFNITIKLPDGTEYKMDRGIAFWENTKVPNPKVMHFLDQMAKAGKSSVTVDASVRIVDNRQHAEQAMPELAAMLIG
jgi:hypothetical protein